MRLRSARITNFKSIEDSTAFGIDDITCLVGKNESGKTSVLQAFYKLNPVDPKAAFDRDTEYPRRHLSEYGSIHKGKPAVVITTDWELDGPDVEIVSALVGQEACPLTEFTATRGYGDSAGSCLPTWSIQADEGKALDFVIKQASLTEQESAALAAQGTPKTIKELKDLLGKVPSPSEGIQKLIAHLDKKFKRGTATRAVIDALDMPEFVYFTNYDLMPGKASIDQLVQRKASNALTRNDEIMLGFLELSGMTLDEIQNTKDTEKLIAKLEGISNRITKRIFKYWTQNRNLKVQVRVDHALPEDQPPYNSGRIISIRILNNLHDVTVPFDERSTGFVWFFSFLVYFSQILEKHGDNLIVLLDEPGLSLHARAQGDLQRYFQEELLPKQVIYTTHSPFMVPADNLLCVRTVEEVVKERWEDGERVGLEVFGTKVNGEALSQDRDTLFPLQGALGYDLTQGLFVGKHSLVVEGPGDLLYLNAMSHHLKKVGRTSLDKRWTITPARGLDRIASFVALLGAQKLNIAVLTDFALKQKKAIEDLRKRNSDLLNEGRIFTAEKYADKAEADIEDILGDELFIHIVNSAFNLTDGHAVAAHSGAGRILNHVEKHFDLLPPESPEFDHYTPAEHLGRNPGLIDDAPGLNGALDRFERLFADLNQLLR